MLERRNQRCKRCKRKLKSHDYWKGHWHYQGYRLFGVQTGMWYLDDITGDSDGEFRKRVGLFNAQGQEIGKWIETCNDQHWVDWDYGDGLLPGNKPIVCWSHDADDGSDSD